MTKEKTLLIVESPAKAKTINKYLGSDYIVKATIGHMFDLPRESLGVKVDDNFIPEYVLSADKKDQLKSIFDAASDAGKILIASDPDREGEAIAWHVARALEKKVKLPIKRVKFHEITKKEIQKAIQNPMEIDEKLFHAQEGRRVLDRLAGYLISPYVIRHFGKGLSAGRVQSVVVRLIVDREKEIDDFKPEEYWTILAYLSKDKEKFIAKYIEKLTNEEDADKIKKDIEQSQFKILSIEEKQQKKNPFPPFITASLNATAFAKLKFPSAKTTKLAQSLYEAGYITYIRTDSTRISDDAVFACRDWLKENKYSVPDKPNYYANKDSAQDAHEAIRPSDPSKSYSDLPINGDEQKLYDLIWKRFMACQMKPAIFDTVSILIESSIGKHKLKANGRILRSKGWLEILDDEDKNDDIKLPIINKGEIWKLIKPGIVAEQKFTKPPSRFTEKTLTEYLKDINVGRPSTYSAILTKVRDRNYVEDKKGIFYPTEIGKKVTNDLVQYFDFLKIDYTAKLEEKLDLIAEGKFDYLSMMKEFYPLLTKQLKEATFAKKIDYGYKCIKCQSMMDLRNGKFGYYLSCINYPDCQFTLNCELDKEGKPIPKSKEAKLTDGVICQRCGSGMIKKDGKFGPFYGCSTWPKCTAIQQIPVGKKCSKCQNEMCAKIFNDEMKLSCMNYPACNNIIPVPKNMHIDWHVPNFKGKITKRTEKVLAKGKKSIDW